jgi:pyruvate kinase
MSISWGVRPELVKRVASTDELFEEGRPRGNGDENGEKRAAMVVLTAGVPCGHQRSTNLIKAQKIE